MTAAVAGDEPAVPRYLGLRRSEWGIAGTSVALNVLVNGILPERMHVPASLAAAGVTCAFGLRAGAGPADQGLRPADAPSGIKLGAIVAVPLTLAIGAGVLTGVRSLHGEGRIVDAAPSRALYEIGVRIPLGTALAEELIFRGAVLGVLSKHHSPMLAATLSSAFFGLWHIAPTLDRLRDDQHERPRSGVQRATAVGVAVGVTSVAGLALSGLRFRSKSVCAPWIAHATVNGAGFAATWLMARRRESERNAAK